MFVNPIIGMLHNTKEERWHPILFVESPLPGPDEPGKPVRHRSKMHHTDGFLVRAEALTYITASFAPAFPGAKLALEKDFAWNGEGVPALVEFFHEIDGVLQPL